MKSNTSKLVPLLISLIISVGVILVSIMTYGIPSSLLGGFESSQIEDINYEKQIPSFNKACLYEYADGRKLVEEFAKERNHTVSLRKGYTDNPACNGRIIGANIPQGIYYEKLDDSQWIELQVSIKQGVPTWSQEPLFLIFLLFLYICFLFTNKSNKNILLGFIVFIIYSVVMFDEYNKYTNSTDQVIPNKNHFENIVSRMDGQ